MTTIFNDICCPDKRGIDSKVLDAVLSLALQIAREGREGRRIGTLFVVGDTERVLALSRPLILDPLYGHPDENKSIFNKDVQETIKELAQLDGAFIVAQSGVVASAARYIDVASGGVDIPLGYGSRHVAGASISRLTDAVAVVVSESSIVRVFDNGEMISEILPEIWMIQQYALSVRNEDVVVRQESNVTVRTKLSAAAGTG